MAKKTNPTPAPEAPSTSDVTFNFVQREGGPERLVSEAELVFPATAGILAGPAPDQPVARRSSGVFDEL